MRLHPSKWTRTLDQMSYFFNKCNQRKSDTCPLVMHHWIEILKKLYLLKSLNLGPWWIQGLRWSTWWIQGLRWSIGATPYATPLTIFQMEEAKKKKNLMWYKVLLKYPTLYRKASCEDVSPFFEVHGTPFLSIQNPPSLTTSCDHLFQHCHLTLPTTLAARPRESIDR